MYENKIDQIMTFSVINRTIDQYQFYLLVKFPEQDVLSVQESIHKEIPNNVSFSIIFLMNFDIYFH